jgi:hypothetical protein
VVCYAKNLPSCRTRGIREGGQRDCRMVRRYLSYKIVKVYLTNLLFRRSYYRYGWMSGDGSGRKWS